MKAQRLLLFGALLALCAFFLHLAAMIPSREAVRRAEALEALLARETPAAQEVLAPDRDGAPPVRPGALKLRPAALPGIAVPVDVRTVLFELRSGA